MASELTDEELDEIERCCAAARPGPWRSWIEGRDYFGANSMIQVGKSAENDDDIEPIGATVEDMDFIARARDDVPRLVAEVRRLRALLR